MKKPSLWRSIQRQNYTDWKALADFLNLEEEKRLLILKNSKFPLNLPVRLAEKIEKNSLEDPILKQFLPLIEENHISKGYIEDPVQDARFRKRGRLLHKYQGRALLVVTSACAMHCRYCFRKNFDYEEKKSDFSEELEVIRQDHSLSEIILSGGDPLSLSNVALGELIDLLGQIPHLKRVRFHTRFPIGIPERIEQEFLKILENSPLQIWFVVHANHARELDEEVLIALKSIQKLGIPVLNQAVLLKGVNDSVSVLKELFEKLIDSGIFPYYLHQLDRVQGSAHFEVEQKEGTYLLGQLAKELPGYGVPKYVSEIAGEAHKLLI